MSVRIDINQYLKYFTVRFLDILEYNLLMNTKLISTSLYIIKCVDPPNHSAGVVSRSKPCQLLCYALSGDKLLNFSIFSPTVLRFLRAHDSPHYLLMPGRHAHGCKEYTIDCIAALYVLTRFPY